MEALEEDMQGDFEIAEMIKWVPPACRPVSQLLSPPLPPAPLSRCHA